MTLKTGHHRASPPPWSITSAKNAFSADQTANDNVQWQFGTAGGESYIASNGTDTIWQMVSGGLTIGLGASAPSPDQDGVHIWKATAGVVTAIAGSLLTLENSGDTFIQMLVPNANASGVYFGTLAANNTGWILYHGSTDTPSATLSLGIAGSARLLYSAGAFAFQEETTISTTAGALTLDPTTTLTGELTAATASAFKLAVGAQNYYVVNTSISSGDVIAHQFAGANSSRAGGAGSSVRFMNLAAWTQTYTGTVQLTALHYQFKADAVTLVASGGAKIVDMAAGIVAQGFTASTDITLTHSSAFRALTGGAAVNVSGLYVEAQTAGTTASYGILLDASTTGDVTGVTTLKLSSLNGAITIAPSAGSLLFTGTLALTGSRVTQSYHTNITSTNAVTVDSWSESKENIQLYGGDALAVLRGTEVISFRHKLDRDNSGRVKLGVRAESILEPLALVDMDYGHGLGIGPALDTMGLTALNTRAIQQIEDIVKRLEQENQELRALVAGRSN